MPEILKKELVEETRKSVSDELTKRLRNIELEVRQTLETLDKRSKDTLGYLVREMNKTASLPTLEQPEEKKSE